MGKRIFLTEEQIKQFVIEAFRRQTIPHYSNNDKLEFGNDTNVVDGGNFPIKRNGQEYWVSRSVTVSLYVFGYDMNGNMYILASKRGPGARGGNGCWCVVGGFLDYGYTLEETCVKECKEECGIDVNENDLIPVGVNSYRGNKRGDVAAKFYTILKDSIENHKPSIANCEPGEATDARWIPINEIQKYRWWGKQGEHAYEFAIRIFNKKGTLSNNKNYNLTITALNGLLNDGIINEEQFNTIINIIKR